VLAATASLAALAAALPSPCPDPALALRCPDLVMAPASHLRAVRSPTGRQVLRMENRIVNIGAGPAELFGQRSSATEMRARQVITNAAGQRRRFETGAELYFKSVPSRGGSYWKWQNAARFELWSLDATAHRAQMIRVGPKHDYCLRDLKRVRFFAGVRRRPFFPHCNQTTSKREVTLGTSVGWADIYPSTYPDNWIDVTGLRGCFAIVQRVDPGHHIFESNEANNVSSRIVRLPFKRGPQRCPQPAPPAPAPPAPAPPPPPAPAPPVPPTP
jgi:hypothetical protein